MTKTTSPSKFSEALALAKLVSEETGVTLEKALIALDHLSDTKAQSSGQIAATKSNALTKPKRGSLPENITNYVATCAAGYRGTPTEIWKACGLTMPVMDKRLSYYLRAIPGWERLLEKRGNTHVWQKN